MPRGPRSIVPGYVYHLTHRGNNKQKLFLNEDDCRVYAHYFEEARSKYGMDVLGYCLMPNHVHYIGIAKDDLSFAETIKCAHGKYAKYFHRRFSSIGHVWQGRFYSCLLDQEHLFCALRYVERNPVRANLVEKPWNWIWSSAKAHLHQEKGIISLKGAGDYLTIDSWKEYIDQEDKDEDLREIRRQTQAIKAWGSDAFKKDMELRFKINLSWPKRGRPKIGTHTDFSLFS